MLYLRQNTRNIFKLPELKNKEDFFLKYKDCDYPLACICPVTYACGSCYKTVNDYPRRRKKSYIPLKYIPCLLIFSDTKSFFNKLYRI